MTIPDRELEESPLSCRVTRDGITVRVLIYRFAGTSDPWKLEVVDVEGTSTVWDDQFATDKEAHKAFFLALEQDGIASFSEPGETRH